MPAYFIVQNTIKDDAQYQRYVQAVVPFIASFGGKLVARRAKVEVLEGEHDQRPVVMFEFPDMDAIHAFWNSPDYVPIKKLREGDSHPKRLGLCGYLIDSRYSPMGLVMLRGLYGVLRDLRLSLTKHIV